MTIECYYSACPYHVNRAEPLCDESECRATKLQLENFKKIRKIYLENSAAQIENNKNFVIEQKRIWFGQLFWWRFNKFLKNSFKWYWDR